MPFKVLKTLFDSLFLTIFNVSICAMQLISFNFLLFISSIRGIDSVSGLFDKEFSAGVYHLKRNDFLTGKRPKFGFFGGTNNPMCLWRCLLNKALWTQCHHIVTKKARKKTFRVSDSWRVFFSFLVGLNGRSDLLSPRKALSNHRPGCHWAMAMRFLGEDQIFSCGGSGRQPGKSGYPPGGASRAGYRYLPCLYLLTARFRAIRKIVVMSKPSINLGDF
jgi:hypothetical protein